MSAEPRVLKTEAERALALQYAAARATLPGSPAMLARRDAAFAVVQRLGLPHRRVEAWKYTDLRALMRRAEPLAPPPAAIAAERALAAAPQLPGLERYRLVVVDGHFRDELSDRGPLLEAGIEVAPTAELMGLADERHHAFLDPQPGAGDDVAVALNTAFATNGVGILVPDGCVLAKPLEVLFLTTDGTPASWYARSFVSVGAGASVRLLLNHAGPDGLPYQANAAMSVALAAGARVKLVSVQAEGSAAQHITTLSATLEDEATLDHLSVTTGAAVSRLQGFVTIAGEGARLGANGATMLGGRTHADTALVIDHAAPGSTTRVNYRTAVDGEATGAFQGRIVVRQAAQKTDARMMTRALLLSDGGEFAAKPELEIYADDVQCGHGATSGRIDDEMLFYLLSRGIPRAEAEQLLLTAFLSEAIDALGEPDIAAALEPMVAGWLARRGEGGVVNAAAARTLAAPYDVERVRRDFPILAKTVHSKPLVYLDNGASAQKPQAVIDRMVRAYRDEYANVHRGLHALSTTATEAYEHARETVRRFINAGSADEIVFTRSSTEALNLVAASLGGSVLREGDEIVLTIMEHHSNIVPWHFHRARSGAVLNWVPVGDDGAFSLEAFEAALTPRTKIVAVTHMSNVLGTVVPVREVCRIAHARGIPVVVDGSQAAVHLPVDVQDLGCDFYAFTGHKLYGPTGIGVLYGRREALAALPPWQGGGEMIRDVTADDVTYADPPMRFEAGTPPIVQAIGLAAAIDYVETLGRDRIAAHEADLADYAHERLSAINSLRIFGTAAGKGAIVAFNLKGIHPHDVSTVIDREGVAVRAGTHCAQPLLDRFGVTATCRASFGLYNTRAEIDRLAEALEKARRLFA